MNIKEVNKMKELKTLNQQEAKDILAYEQEKERNKKRVQEIFKELNINEVLI